MKAEFEIFGCGFLVRVQDFDLCTVSKSTGYMLKWRHKTVLAEFVTVEDGHARYTNITNGVSKSWELRSPVVQSPIRRVV